MKDFFSPSTKGFYHVDVHGPRTNTVPDPAFRYSEDPEAKAEPDYIDEPNPDCQIPVDAIALSAVEKTALLDAQGNGKVISVVNGKVVAIDPPGPSAEQHTANLRSTRNNLLAACDWTQMPDADLTDVQRAAWKKYRQALRDLTDTTKDPAKVVWPTSPA